MCLTIGIVQRNDNSDKQNGWTAKNDVTYLDKLKKDSGRDQQRTKISDLTHFPTQFTNGCEQHNVIDSSKNQYCNDWDSNSIIGERYGAFILCEVLQANPITITVIDITIYWLE